MKIPILSRFFKKEDDTEKIIEEKIYDAISRAIEERAPKKRKRVSIDPIETIESVCNDYGISLHEFAVRCMAHYIVSTGGVDDDPLSVASRAVSLMNEIDSILKKEPSSISRLREYTNAINTVAEFKDSVEKLKKKKMDVEDMIALLKSIGL